MSSPVEQIKERLSIADVVGSYIKLEKAGANFRARCPFHNEKTPSFFVSPARDTFHCFGCNKGGDIVTFVQEIEGLDFLGALETLAARAGIELKPVNKEVRSEQDRLLAIMASATEFYARELQGHPEALSYLKGRGVTDETITAFKLGFAPDGWRNLHDYLIKQGYGESDIETAGLAIKANTTSGARGDRYYDRFRSRIMFPIADSAGRTIAFSGRIFGGDGKETAKYINSPQTPLYDKSQALYGYDKAKLAIKREDKCILVEGQMDLVMSHQAGIAHTIAVSGTALSEKHLKFIKRLSNIVVMAFDADLAGIAASKRAVDMAIELGMEVALAELPEGLDPADVIAKDPTLWHASIDKARHFIDFYVSVLARRGLDSRALKVAVTKEVLPYVARLTNAIEQAHFVGKIADLLNIGEEPIWIEIKKISQGSHAVHKVYQTAPEVLKKSRREMLEAHVFSILFWQGEEASPRITVSLLEEKLRSFLGNEGFETKRVAHALDKDRLILEAEIAYAAVKNLETELEELLLRWQIEILQDQIREVTGNIKQAEQTDDYEAMNLHLKQYQEITKALNDLKNKNS